ncbi:MAG TPA: AraC family transcriptional regulator [Pyrinomonadaceae bacterium]
MDVLSEVLRVVRLEGALFFNAEFSAPWCLSTRPSAIAPYLSPHDRQLIIYHFVTEGRAYAQLHDGQREELSAGDVVVFPHGDPHLLGNGSSEPVDSMKTFGRSLSDGLNVARFGGGGEVTRFVCGFMVCEPRLGQVFLGGLPRLLKVRVVAGASDEWLEQAIRFSVGEHSASNGTSPATRTSSAGSELVRSRLAELLFVETLRRYINELPAGATGWLAGVRDSFIAHALALLHKDPARPWTIADLAREVGLSRSRLAERFRHFLGESPMAYLAQWRLRLGAEILQTSDDSVAQVASAVGYGSEAAFNRAFKREFASPPAAFRQRHCGNGHPVTKARR